MINYKTRKHSNESEHAINIMDEIAEYRDSISRENHPFIRYVSTSHIISFKEFLLIQNILFEKYSDCKVSNTVRQGESSTLTITIPL